MMIWLYVFLFIVYSVCKCCYMFYKVNEFFKNNCIKLYINKISLNYYILDILLLIVEL